MKQWLSLVLEHWRKWLAAQMSYKSANGLKTIGKLNIWTYRHFFIQPEAFVLSNVRKIIKLKNPWIFGRSYRLCSLL